VFVYILMC